MADVRQERFKTFARSGDVGRGYQCNSQEEDAALHAVKQFADSYHKYFPDRKPLLLSALNECNQPKMISTFIRPTALPYDELFNPEGCCKFVAGYMRYESFYDSAMYASMNGCIERFPAQIASPATALNCQSGNCLEISLILVSFLRGIGCNAFVVCGRANAAVCLGDQSKCEWVDDIPEEKNSDDDEEPVTEIEQDYLALMKQRPHLRRVTEPDPWKVSDDDDDGDVCSPTAGAHPVAASPDVCDGYQVKPAHCWVLILPGGRKTLKNAVLVEASTGQMIPLSKADSFYTGIDSIFNESSYFVCLHHNSPPSSLSFDLKDLSKWEPVVAPPHDVEEKDLAAMTMSGTARRPMADSIGLSASATFTLADSLQTIGRPVVSLPRSWTSEPVLTPAQYASRYPERAKVLHFANATVKLFAEYSQSDLRVKEVHLADSVYPDMKQIHIIYAHRADKLRRRSVFPKAAGVTEARDDQFNSNSHYGAQGVENADLSDGTAYRLLWEWYGIGRMQNASVEGLREHIHEPGKHRTLRFFWRAREDGLARRIEIFYDARSLRKVKELYRGRADRLSCRSATFDRPKTVKEANAHSAFVSPGSAAGLKAFPRLEPIKMSQKFEYRESATPEKEVAKVKFTRPQGGDEVGEMWVYFHYNEDSIIRPYHVFSKGSSKVEDYIASSASQKPVEPPVKVVTIPGMTPPSDLDLFNERKWLSGMEAECLAAVRKGMDDQLTMLLTMEREHAVVLPLLSVYDTLRNRPKETEAERARKIAEAARREESRKDYLAPYIAKLEMPSDFDGDYLKVRLTAEQAKQVRDEALTELKERLIQRGQIMQSRMDKEKEDFHKRQLQYQKNSDNTAVDGGKEDVDFALYCKEATWRMKVLDERLSQHIDHASVKYAQLAQTLAEDPRLAALYGS